ncbi:hypothetical protein L1987_60173 [Smallanthus sonchifolius]|uniref:Uncharacterized protein n=1 Tax=Smallanthus sonchifolius TaxID=185202 RepID=A0ACB9D7A6_9ASTR|nr:hypothetical protein L1987_60173 [Smallanthus sonchifolius]
MLEENPNPYFGIDDEIEDLLSSGVEDNNDEDDGYGGDDGNAGDRSEVRDVKETVQDEQVSKEDVQDNEAPVDNNQVESQVSPVTDKRIEVENLTENVDKIVEDEVIVEKEQFEMEIDTTTPKATIETTKKRKESEKNVPSRPPPSKGIIFNSLEKKHLKTMAK